MENYNESIISGLNFVHGHFAFSLIKHGDFLKKPYDVWKILCSSALRK